MREHLHHRSRRGVTMAVVAAVFVAATASFARVSGASFDAAVICMEDCLMRDSMRDNSSSRRRRKRAAWPFQFHRRFPFRRRRRVFFPHSLTQPATSSPPPKPSRQHPGSSPRSSPPPRRPPRSPPPPSWASSTPGRPGRAAAGPAR